MKADQVKKMSEQAFEKLVEAVEAGKSEKLTDYLKAMGRFHRYSLMNSMLIGFQKPDATHVAGFRTWQKLGRRVRKGEHGIGIMAPIAYRKQMRPEPEKDQAAGEEEVEQVMAFRTVHVFDISQTNGKPLPEFARVRGDPAECTIRLKELISEQGIKLKYSDRLGATEGLSAGGTIVIRSGLKAAEEFSVLVHEVTHELVHRGRDNKTVGKKVRETEAEAVAFVVCHGIGLDVGTAGSDYIQLYDGDRKTLMESLGRIQKTSRQILTAITEKQVGMEKPLLVEAA